MQKMNLKVTFFSNAYITTSFDTQSDLGFIDVTAGRYVTSWGEATFIPVGANGLVTNSFDLLQN